MKVIHIESGLGNQMLSYCEYLALRQANPDDDFYIENIIYDIPECNEVTCQWNGYELERIFGIQKPANVRTLCTDRDWEQLMKHIRDSRFWEKNMNYPVHFTEGFHTIGLELKNTFGDFEDPRLMAIHHPDVHSLSYRLKKHIRHTQPYMRLKMWNERRPIPLKKLDCKDNLFLTTDENLFAGQKLKFKYKGSGIERIDREIRQVFQFPEITDEKNLSAYQHITSCNAVAIHARRGDMLGQNYSCYATGYFKRAVAYLRRHTNEPVFYIFCDPDSVEWVKTHPQIFGLHLESDEVHFVDWNKGLDSFRDLQLMAACKHQVITNSSFGWWGAYLNTNPYKITISPQYEINTTHTL